MERRELPYGWDDLKGRLQNNMPRLLKALGIAEPIKGDVVTPLNPTRRDRKAGSFVIWAGGKWPGSWQDFATGEKGDVFDLIAYLAFLQSKMDAYWWALEFLGLGRGNVRSKEQAAVERERFEREKAAAEARDIAREDAKAAELKARWLKLAPLAGTLGEVYLREARRIPLERLNHLPRALRFDPACEHRDDDTGEVTEWPAIVSAMTRGSKSAGLHRTYLAPDGLGKAPVEKAKKMIGSVRGAAIRLTRGEGDLRPADREKSGRHCPLMVGEGIETTLTCAAAQPGYASWAAGSLSLMGLLDWPAWASAVILLRDNDWGTAEAVKAFERAEAHWRGQANGRVLKVVGSAVGSDFNDWVKR